MPNPVAAVPRRKIPKRLPSYLKPDEVTQLLPHVPDQWQALFACAVYTGMRRGELVALRSATWT
jgi:integrase